MLVNGAGASNWRKYTGLRIYHAGASNSGKYKGLRIYLIIDRICDSTPCANSYFVMKLIIQFEQEPPILSCVLIIPPNIEIKFEEDKITLQNLI